MADADYEIQRHDRLPVIRATLSADLTTAVGVNFIMREATDAYVPIFTGAPKVNAAATIESSDPEGSVVSYSWLGVDTDTAGTYVGQWEVQWPSSKPQSFPTKTYHTILIRADLDDAA